MDRSPLFAIGLTLRGSQKWGLGSGFFDVVWVSGYFLAKSDKIWVSEALRFFTEFYYQFTDETTLNLMALKLPLW